MVGLASSVLDEALLDWTVGHLFWVAWGSVTIRVGDQDVFVALRC